jgi:hypothetical protein
LRAVGPDEPLHLQQAAGETQTFKLAVKHHAVKAHFRCAPLNQLGKAVELARPPLALPRLPGPQP